MRSTQLAVAFVLAAGCGGAAAHQIPIEGTRARLLRGPEGRIAVVETPEGNREVQIQLDQLPPPSAYDRQDSSFAVWIVPAEGVPVRAGDLRYDAHSHYGHANVVTPYDRFHVVVTAEPRSPNRAAPGPNVILDEAIVS
jgi:hypothetical protein